jgi:N-acetylmuramoyl-L-alanine amidase
MRNRWLLWANLSWLLFSGGGAIGQTPPPQPIRLAANVSRPVLTTGSRATEVAELQAALRLLGYYSGGVDGVYGETTIAAVTRFQQAAGLTADGIVGNATWERLFPAVAAAPPPASSATAPTPTPATPTATPSASATVSLPLLKLGMRGAAVMGLQERLKALELFDGAIDGVFGNETQTAVKAAQKKYQLNPDGIVGPTTWSVLLREK